MMQRSFMILAAAVATVAPATSSFAQTDVSAELAALKARIADLEARQRAAGEAAQGRATDVAVSDAAARSQLPQSEKIVTGWDKGFKIGSADGNYSIMPIVQAQFRNVTNFTEGGDESDDSTVNGFEFRRVRLGVKGNAFSKDFIYEVRVSVDRNTGEAILDNAYGQYRFADDWAVKFGQFKLNWTREETISGLRQLAAERSLLNHVLGGSNTSFVQGVSLQYAPKDGPFRADVQFTDGDLTANTGYQDVTTTAGYQNFGVAARGEYKISGNWDAYNDLTALGTKDDLLVVGAGTDWAQGGDGDVYRFTVDASWENTTGLAVYGSAIYTIAEGDTGEAPLDDSIGALAQAAYLLPGLENWEGFGRYSIIHLDDEIDGEDLFHEATVGVNKYFYSHNAKFTLDLNWLPNGTPTSASGLGYSNSTEEQIILRTQIQFVL